MVRSLLNRNDRNVAPFAPLSRVFEQFFDEPFVTLMPVTTPGAQPGFALDMSEDDTNVIIRATLPGYTKDEINVEVDEGVLTISGEHNEEHTEGAPGEKFYRRERRHGSVQRRLALPMPVREDQAIAELTHGVLTLKLPKVQKAPAKKISIGDAAPIVDRVSIDQPRPDAAKTNQPKAGCRC